MRYYSIKLTDPSSGTLYQAPSLSGALPDATWTSYVNGQTIPGTLNIELDIPVSTFATIAGNAWVRVWGIGIEEMSQAHDLVGKNLAISGGMKKGLPLAPSGSERASGNFEASQKSGKAGAEEV
jgi:hypothetical protein